MILRVKGGARWPQPCTSPLFRPVPLSASTVWGNMCFHCFYNQPSQHVPAIQLIILHQSGSSPTSPDQFYIEFPSSEKGRNWVNGWSLASLGRIRNPGQVGSAFLCNPQTHGPATQGSRSCTRVGVSLWHHPIVFTASFCIGDGKPGKSAEAPGLWHADAGSANRNQNGHGCSTAAPSVQYEPGECKWPQADKMSLAKVPMR